METVGQSVLPLPLVLRASSVAFRKRISAEIAAWVSGWGRRCVGMCGRVWVCKCVRVCVCTCVINCGATRRHRHTDRASHSRHYVRWWLLCTSIPARFLQARLVTRAPCLEVLRLSKILVEFVPT